MLAWYTAEPGGQTLDLHIAEGQQGPLGGVSGRECTGEG